LPVDRPLGKRLGFVTHLSVTQAVIRSKSTPLAMRLRTSRLGRHCGFEMGVASSLFSSGLEGDYRESRTHPCLLTIQVSSETHAAACATDRRSGRARVPATIVANQVKSAPISDALDTVRFKVQMHCSHESTTG
jgi:hypothetical protein